MVDLFHNVYRWLGGLRAPPDEFTGNDVARATALSNENPLCMLNNPDHWSRARRWKYRGALVLLWNLAAFPLWLGMARPGIEVLVALWLVSFPIQVYAELWILRAFEFVRGRQWILEELSLTPLGWKAIGYGSCHRAVRFAGIFVGAATVWDVILISQIFSGDAILFVFIACPPFRWLLHGLSVSHGLRDLPRSYSESRVIAILLIPVLIFAKIACLAAGVAILLALTGIVSAFLTFDFGIWLFLTLSMVLLFSIWIGTGIAGEVFIWKGYAEAIHAYKTMVSEANPTVSLRPDAMPPADLPPRNATEAPTSANPRPKVETADL